MPRRGFEVLPRRWVAERNVRLVVPQPQKMSKDYERLCATSEAFVYAAMVRLMVRRLARAPRDFQTVSLGSTVNKGKRAGREDAHNARPCRAFINAPLILWLQRAVVIGERPHGSA